MSAIIFAILEVRFMKKMMDVLVLLIKIHVLYVEELWMLINIKISLINRLKIFNLHKYKE